MRLDKQTRLHPSVVESARGAGASNNEVLEFVGATTVRGGALVREGIVISPREDPAMTSKNIPLMLDADSSDFDDADSEKNAEETEKVRPGVGLLNMGFTCYVNATVQCLAHLPQFRSALTESRLALQTQAGAKHAPSASALRHVVRSVFPGTSPKPFAPRKLLARVPSMSPQLSHFRQEDAHEFLTALLDSISQGFSGELIHDCFAGKLRSTLACPHCGYESHNTESFVDLSVEVQKSHENSYQQMNGTKHTSKSSPHKYSRRLRQKPSAVKQTVHSTVDAALAEFFKVETLDGDNAWACTQCSRRVRATKRLTLEKTPAGGLIVHLKRFQMSFLEAYPRQHKISSHVGFSPHLQLPGTQQSYELSGVLVHEGATTRSGHYSAFIRHQNQWFLFDDDLVEGPLNPDTVFRQQAYLLFYAATTSSTPPVSAAPISPPLPLQVKPSSLELPPKSGETLITIYPQLRYSVARRRWQSIIWFSRKKIKSDATTMATSAKKVTKDSITEQPERENDVIRTPGLWNGALSNLASWNDEDEDAKAVSHNKRKMIKSNYRYDSWDQALDQPHQRKKKKNQSTEFLNGNSQARSDNRNPFESLARRKGFD